MFRRHSHLDGSTPETGILPAHLKPATRWRTRLAWLAALLAVVAWAAYLLRPQSPFERYVSPPMDAKGTRLEFLIPRGWRCVRFVPANTKASNGPVLEFEPPQQIHGLPAWVPRLFLSKRTSQAYMNVYWYDEPFLSWLPPGEVRGPLPDGSFLADRSFVLLGRGRWLLQYSGDDKRQFLATYKQILDSVRVR